MTSRGASVSSDKPVLCAAGEVCSFRNSLARPNAVSAQKDKPRSARRLQILPARKVFRVATAPKIIMFKICVEG